MSKVVLITVIQKDSLVGELYDNTQYFNPTEDDNGLWFISIEERDNNIHSKNNWISLCPEIDHNPKTE